MRSKGLITLGLGLICSQLIVLNVYASGRSVATSLQIVNNAVNQFLSWGVDESEKKASINLQSEKIQNFQSKKDVIIAVVDTGVDINHPFLKENIYVPEGRVNNKNYGLDFSSKVNVSKTPFDHHGHGTHVAGIIRSVFPKAKLLILKYYNPLASGQENLNATIRALNYAVNANVDVINYSGGGPEASEQEKRILERAREKGILVVAAAGNERSNIDKKSNAYYPASYGLENIITVTAHDRNAEPLPSSNWGRKSIDVSAPGNRIKSSIPQGRAGLMTGTSQATAFVTGVVGMLKSAFPKLSNKKIREIIKNSARKIGSLQKVCASGGMLDATKAMLSAASLFNKKPQEQPNKKENKKATRVIAFKKKTSTSNLEKFEKAAGKILFLKAN